MIVERPHYRSFLRVFAATLALGVAAAVGTVLLVDPYSLHNVVSVPGFNAIKPGLVRYQAEIKSAQAIAQQPDTLFLGNSRAEIGFDPHGAGLAGRRAYNLAIPDDSQTAALWALRQVQSAGARPKTIVLGVEFLDFLQRRNGLNFAPADARDAPMHGVQWRFDAAFSLQSLRDAATTLLIQHDSEAVTLAPQGLNPLHDYGAFVRKGGYFLIFEQRAQESARQYQHKLKGALTPQRGAELATLLDLAGQHGADVQLVIYPYHAQIMALFERTGLWPAFEAWKDELLRQVMAARRAHPEARYTLTDFSGYGAYQCERIPAAGDTISATRWYWEAGHFKRELGDLMLAQVLTPGGQTAAGAFGMRLEPDTLALNSQRIAAERATCLDQNTALFQHVEKLVAQVN